MVGAGAGGWGFIFNGDRVSVWKVESSGEDGGDGHTAVWMPLTWTLNSN